VLPRRPITDLSAAPAGPRALVFHDRKDHRGSSHSTDSLDHHRGRHPQRPPCRGRGRPERPRAGLHPGPHDGQGAQAAAGLGPGARSHRPVRDRGHRRLRRWPGPVPARRRAAGRRGRSAKPADPTPPGQVRPLDAEAAARAALAGTASGSPKARDGAVEAIWALRVARRSALKARTQAANQLDAQVISAPEPLAVSCAGWLPPPGSPGSPPCAAGRHQPTRSRRPSWPCGNSPGATRP
jgi:hypothetical protein